jgi:hypothetical protein
MRIFALALGVIFAVIAVVYWVLPAGSLPGFFPGFEAGSLHIHVKHGVAAAAAALLMFAAAWYAGRARA